MLLNELKALNDQNFLADALQVLSIFTTLAYWLYAHRIIFFLVNAGGSVRVPSI